MIVVGFLLFCFGIAFGASVTRTWASAMTEVERNKHEKIVIMQGQEIARLRAQVALHIGKEK